MRDFPSEYAAFLRNFNEVKAKLAKLKKSLSSYEEENREFVSLVLETSLADSIGNCEKSMQGVQMNLLSEEEEIKKLALIDEYDSLLRNKAILSDPWPQLLSLLKKIGAKGTDAVALSLIGDDFDRAIEAYQQQVIKLSKQAVNPNVIKRKMVLSADNHSNSIIDEELKTMKAGDTITFGRYPQTASGKDMTPIEWQILDREKNWVLVISKYGLDVGPFHDKDEDITWEKSALRVWLNSTFTKEAFNDQEIEAIRVTWIRNDDEGNDTIDRLFLPNYEEAKRYFGDDDSKKCMPTDYTMTKCTSCCADELCYYGSWWLRSSRYDDHALTVKPYGVCDTLVTDEKTMIRPTMWINLISDTISTVYQNEMFQTNYSDLASIQVGGIIKLGRYPQEKPFYKRDPIEWQVLAKKGNCVLAISRFVLDKQQYNTGRGSVTWKDSSIRAWLNGVFFNTAFNQFEQSMIVETAMNEERTLYDKVFLLSVQEANQYFSCNENRKCSRWTHYSLTRYGSCDWWLRTRGEISNYTAVVSSYDGSIFESGSRVDTTQAVRPAIWIDFPGKIKK